MFGFLKNKIKEWVDTAKEKLKPVEAEEKPEEINISKEPEKKEAIKESSEAKASELAIKKKLKKVKKEKSKKITKESESKDLLISEPSSLPEEKKAFATKEDEIKTEQEHEKIQEIAEELEKGDISIKEAVKEIQEISKEEEKTIKESLESKEESEGKKSFFKKLFGKKEEVEKKAIEKIQIPSEIQEKKSEEKSFFQKVKSSFAYKITEEDFNSLFESLEMLLLENNVALESVEDIKSSLSKKLIGKEISKNDLESEIKKELKNSIEEILIDPEDPIELIKIKKSEKDEPFVILFFGVNGTGKTTSIAKLAHLLKEKSFSVVLAAADTFRAASIEQIAIHAEKLKIHLIKQDYGADPSAVGFDAIKYAQNHKIDVVLIDTAGRMHTKTNLISEMEKICRVTKPDLKIFVAESIAGNDAIEQARTFNEAIGINGSILSKADVDEKGGTIISVSHVTKKPIIYLGTGQKYEDLKLFNKEDFIKSLGL